jgi:hypothetical protein
VYQVAVVLVAGTQTVKVNLNQLDVDMKTRQEMIYDFMLALCSDLSCIRSETETALEGVNLIYTYASHLADKFLEKSQ